MIANPKHKFCGGIKMEDKFTETLLDELEDDNAQSQFGRKGKSIEEKINDCIKYYTAKVNPYGFLDSGFNNETDYLASMSRDLHDIYYVDEWLKNNSDEPILCKQLEEIKGELTKKKQANMEQLENMVMEELLENMRKKFKAEREPDLTDYKDDKTLAWDVFIKSKEGQSYLATRYEICKAVGKVLGEHFSPSDEQVTEKLSTAVFWERYHLKSNVNAQPNKKYLPLLLDEFSAKLGACTFDASKWDEIDFAKKIAKNIEDVELKNSSNELIERLSRAYLDANETQFVDVSNERIEKHQEELIKYVVADKMCYGVLSYQEEKFSYFYQAGTNANDNGENDRD